MVSGLWGSARMVVPLGSCMQQIRKLLLNVFVDGATTVGSRV